MEIYRFKLLDKFLLIYYDYIFSKVNKDFITGQWFANGRKGLLRMEFVDKPVRAFYDYDKIGENKARGEMIKNCGEWYAPACILGNSIVAKFTAKSRVILDMPNKVQGKFIISSDTGRFDLFYKGDPFGSGRIDPFYRPIFFDPQV